MSQLLTVFLQLLAAKKEINNIKCSGKDNEKATDPSSPSDCSQPASDNSPNIEGTSPFTNNYPVTMHNNKDSYRYDTDKKLVIDWV